jgi:hypothetical protein
MSNWVARAFVALHGVLLWVFVAGWGFVGFRVGDVMERGTGTAGYTAGGVVLGLAVGFVLSVTWFGFGALLIESCNASFKLIKIQSAQLELMQALLRHQGVPFDAKKIEGAASAGKALELAPRQRLESTPEAEKILKEPDVLAQRLIVNANEMLRNAITHNRYRRPAGARLVWSRGYRGHLIEIYDDSTVSVRGEDLIFAGVDEAIRVVDVRARQMGG